MLGLGRRAIFASSAALACGAVLASTSPFEGASAASTRALPATPAAAAAPLAGTWRRLPAAPIAPNAGLTSVWTGTELLLFGRVETHAKDGTLLERSNVAAAYNPATNRWRRLLAPTPTSSFMGYSSAWTGRELLVWGPGTHAAFDPKSNRWRQLPPSPLLAAHDGFGLVAWSGRELVGWGGGCCGEAFSNGVAYVPSSDSWRALAPSPLAGSQGPIGAWTGHELLVFVGNVSPAGTPWPATLARGAAYDPASDSWRRIAAMPVEGGTAIWDGRELLVVGGGASRRSALAYNPATNRWLRLAALPSSRLDAAIVWTGRRLLLWGGTTRAPAGGQVIPPHGLAYDPRANRWSALPAAPIAGRENPAAAWNGHAMIVWGGSRAILGGGTESLANGAFFTPARR